jgi:hypothetical protein
MQGYSYDVNACPAPRCGGYMLHTTGFPSNWSANVLSWSNTDYYYLANHYVGLPDHGEIFSDGLGRALQEQHQLKTTNIVSANTTYDPLGRPQKGYKAYDWDFGGASRLLFVGPAGSFGLGNVPHTRGDEPVSVLIQVDFSPSTFYIPH